MPGEVEYAAGFVRTIDKHIACVCISCFPDVIDPVCCCAYRFRLEK